MVIEGSDTDMIVAQPLPLTEFSRRPLALGEVRRDGPQTPRPRGVWGSVNPLEGKKALDLMEIQVKGIRRESLQVL